MEMGFGIKFGIITLIGIRNVDIFGFNQSDVNVIILLLLLLPLYHFQIAYAWSVTCRMAI